MRAGAALLVAVAAAVGCQAKKSKEQQPPPEPGPVVEEVDERWEQVVEWAEPTVEPADASELKRAVELAADHRRAVRDAKQSSQRYAAEQGALPPEVNQAVAALVAWAEAGGGIERGVCDDQERVMARDMLVAHEVSRAALLTAPDDPDHPNVRAVLYLAQRLRAEGNSVMEISVGAALAGAAVEWADARGVTPGKAFRELAPSEDFVFRAVAAEAACQVQIVEAAGRQDQTIGTQLDAVRAFNTDTVHGAFRRKDDPQQLEAYLLARGEQARKQSDTPSLRTFSAAYRMFAELRKERDAYTRGTRGTRSRVEPD